jgi:aminopeptidase S
MRWAGLLAALVLAGCTGPPSTATPTPTTGPGPSADVSADASPAVSPSAIASPPPTSELTATELRAAVQVSDIRTHLEELQGVADANGGNRATGTLGFDASVDYVANRLTEAGYDVVRQAFTVDNIPSVNLLVERTGAEPAVVMLGAHLDSVEAGPGINDNGSGVAALLVIAERLAELPAPGRTVRLAFWGAEEGGPHGSRAYVDALSADELARINAYLNFDMLASPNPIRFVYAEAAATEGSDALTALFTSYFDGEGLAWAPIDLAGKSDHAAFTDAGIPTGGLFSGGREPKTDEQAALFGGAGGQPADPCSDQSCDTIGNIDEAILAQMADAIAHAVATLAAGD